LTEEKEYKLSAELRAKRRAYAAKPEAKMKKAAYAKEYNARPHVKLKNKMHRASPEYKEYIRSYESRKQVIDKHKENRYNSTIETWREIFDG
jgi:hypothetical protein